MPQARFSRVFVVTALLAPLAASAVCQAPPATVPPDSVEVVAGKHYGAGGFHRLLFGSGYRDLWTMPIRVEVLDLRTFGGGLRPLKKGGGFQTKSLHLVTPDHVEYVFRSADKGGSVPAGFKRTVVAAVFLDQNSASHPTAGLVAAPLLEAAGVLHVNPVLVVMPDDSLLGEFRPAFAGLLGTIEESPESPKHQAAFADAVAIIDSDSLLVLLNHDPDERIDAPALLVARLMDMMFSDWDRHPGQWKWARLQAGPRSPWMPIPRDRDRTFVSYGGVIVRAASVVLPTLVPYRAAYPSVGALTTNSLEFDRRLLGGLAKPVWDSVVGALVQRITDHVIDEAMLALPREQQAAARGLAVTLKQRRDGLPGAADRFYRMIAVVADIHATDGPDYATVTRIGDRFVDVRLASGQAPPYFLRRFDRLETREIRVYLHGGADTARVFGDVNQSIRLRIVGGNGANQLLDSSRVADRHTRAELYDVGTVHGVRYGPDTLFNREPWVRVNGKMTSPGRDRGDQVAPILDIGHDHDLGFLPRVGISSTHYGFGRRPYASRVGFEVGYASSVRRFRIGLATDRRFEGTPFHVTAVARMSEIEIINFHGFGNATPDTISGSSFFQARQRQWLLAPALGLALSRRSDLSLGPVLQFSTTDSIPNRFISRARPYGFGRFGEVGLRIGLHHDARDQPRDPHRGLLIDITASAFPAVWDVTSAFARLTASARAYVTLPIPVHPVLVLSSGANKLFGTFPFHEAANLGGLGTLRSLPAQRYQGDASVYGSTELRVSLAHFAFVFPLNVGVFGVLDAGRVFVAGTSPGGWHTSRGIGFWVGILDASRATRTCWRPGESGPC